MRNKKLNSILLLVISFLFVLSPIVAVRGDLYACPSTSAGDTKILEVTVVDAADLQDIFGTGWKTVLNDSFSGDASTLGAKFKTVVKGIRTNDSIDYSFYGAGVVSVCNITVDSWAFTTGEFLEANKTTSQVYVMKDPANLTAYVQGVRAYLHSLFPGLYSEGNVTVPWAADVSYSPYLAQLPVPPGGYLADIIWDAGWYSAGAKIIHDVTAGYTVPFTTFTYLEDCTESWIYYDNGALIGYSLVNNESKVVYQYSIVLPGSEGIPGYELSIFIGVSVVTMIGLILYMKRKR
jgi:hypothetical protein